MARRKNSLFDPDDAEKDEYAGKLVDKGNEDLVPVTPGKLRFPLLSGGRYAVQKVDMKKPLFDQDSMSDQSDEEDYDDDDSDGNHRLVIDTGTEDSEEDKDVSRRNDDDDDSDGNRLVIDTGAEDTEDSEEDKDVSRIDDDDDDDSDGNHRLVIDTGAEDTEDSEEDKDVSRRNDDDDDSDNNRLVIDTEAEDTEDSWENKGVNWINYAYYRDGSDVNRIKGQLKTSQVTNGDEDLDDLGAGLGDDSSGMEDADKWGKEEDDDEHDDDMDDTSDEGEQDKLQIMKAPGDGAMALEKALALVEQLQTWDSLLALRIHSQKLSNHVNQLPLPTTWQRFQDAGGAKWERAAREVPRKLRGLLDDMLSVQTSLSQQFPATQHLAVEGQEGSSTKPETAPGAYDEEIPSDDDNEEASASPTKEKASPSRLLKRKLSLEDYERVLAKRHKKLCAYSNQVIQVLDDQTSFEQGSLKKFQSFHIPVTKQIEQIMAGKDRLLKRSQLLRTNQRILGTLEEDDAKDREPNIYDDNDLHQKLLHEFVSRKSADDPILRSRQWADIQSMRSKLKRKVDTKASKGRKLRYNVVARLVNFFARRDGSGPQWTDEAVDNLFSSVGGSRAERKDDEKDGEEHGGMGSSETPTKDGKRNGFHREEEEELSDGEEDVDDSKGHDNEDDDEEEDDSDGGGEFEINSEQKDLVGLTDEDDDDDNVGDEDDEEEEEKKEYEKEHHDDDEEEEEEDEDEEDGEDGDESDESL